MATSPAPDAAAPPGMCPGIAVLGGGGGGGDGDGSGDGNGAGAGGDGKGKAGDGSGDGKNGGEGCGDPICPITGRMFLDVLELAFAGPMPLRFTRSYNSRTSNVAGDLGYGWTHTFGWRLVRRRRGVEVFDDRGKVQRFDTPPSDGLPVQNALGWRLSRSREGFELHLPKEQMRYHFAPDPAEGGAHWLIAAEDRNKNRIHVERSDRGVLTGLVDSAGRSYRVTADAAGRVLSIAVAADAERSAWVEIVRYTYDEAGNLASVTDAEGCTNRFAYDGHLVIEHRLACGLSYCYRYDGRDHEARCLETWGEYIGAQDVALHEPIAVRPAGKDKRWPKGINSRRFLYEPRTRYSEVENGLGGVERFFGDEQGRVVKHVDAAGAVIEKMYDADHGGLVAESMPNGALRTGRFDGDGMPLGFVGPDGEGVRALADPDGTIFDVDERNGRISARRYDLRGNLVYREHADDTREVYEHDERGLLVIEVDRRGATTRYAYDAMGNMVRCEPHGGGEVLCEFDYLGRRTSYTDARGRRTEWRWNMRNEVVWKRHADGSEMRIVWDANSKPVTIEDAGRTWTYAYGGLGWLTEIKGPAGEATSYRYDVEGNLVWVKNPRGQVHEQRFDRASRPVGATTFEGVVLDGTLDADGHLVSSRTPLGDTKSTYDDNGQLAEVEYHDGETVTLAHLVGAGPTRIDNGVALVEQWYDGAGQIRRDRQGAHESAVQWLGGDVSAIVSDVGLAVTVTREPSGPETDLAVGSTHFGLHHAEGVDFLTYLGDSLVLRRRRGPTGLLERQILTRRDPSLALDRVGTTEDPNVIWWATYEHDAAQLLRREHRPGDVTIEYEVDAAGQITEKRTWEQGKLRDTERLAYDRAGTPRMAGVVLDHLARPVALGDETFTYDVEGRLEKRTTPDGEWRYTWSASGCLVRVEAPHHVVEMDYDGRGRRMRKRVLRQRELVSSTSYVWANQVVLHEVDDLSGSTRTYARENTEWEPLGHVDVRGGLQTPCFYVTDPVGALDFAVDHHGKIVYAAERSVFGDYRATVETERVSVRLLNQHHDPDVGLVYNRFRWYDPRLGVYVSRDPLELDGTPNPRDYAPNPRRYVDPLGLEMSMSGNKQPDGHGHPTRPDKPSSSATENQTNTYLTQPGHFATNGTKGTPGYVTADDTERSGRGFRSSTTTTIDNAGDNYGCHSCGRKRKQIEKEDGAFGHWRKDHQPPLSHVKAGDKERDKQNLPKGNVRIYPHCPRCSSTQGGLLASRPPSTADAQRAAATMNPRASDNSRMGPPRR